MAWTDEIIHRLKALWAEGHPTAEIGRRIGISKNAVVGKAHRLGLDARPSPIRRGLPGEPARRPSIRRVTGPTLPTMVTPPWSEPPVPTPPAPPELPETAPPAPVPAPALRAISRLPGGSRAPGGRLVTCCWPTGEPGTRSFRFCDGESLPGKPYCATHAALAYVKVRDRREDAA